MYLLDTNVVSTLDARRQPGARELVSWILRNGGSLFLSVVTVMELEAGILNAVRLGRRSRADELRRFVDTLEEAFRPRLLPVSLEAAREAARLADVVRGLDVGTPDLLIAATAQVSGLTVLTRNLRHFEPMRIRVLDPFVVLPLDV